MRQRDGDPRPGAAAIAVAKRELRARVRARRRAIDDAERSRLGAALSGHARDLVARERATRIAAFLPGEDEPDLGPFLRLARERGLEVLVPLALPDRTLDWALYEPGAQRAHPLLRVPEPTGPPLGRDALDSADLLLIPAASIDREGRRCGWGLGYYDRALAGLTDRVPVFAVVYTWEVVASVPTDQHDATVDGAVTPDGIILRG